MRNSPHTRVSEGFKDKKSLIEAVQKLATKDLWIDRLNADKGLERVSNAKLLRLHAVLSAVKSEHGSRSEMIGAILKLENRAKDEGYQSQLEGFATPALWGRFQAKKKVATASK